MTSVIRTVLSVMSKVGHFGLTILRTAELSWGLGNRKMKELKV